MGNIWLERRIEVSVSIWLSTHLWCQHKQAQQGCNILWPGSTSKSSLINVGDIRNTLCDAVWSVPIDDHNCSTSHHYHNHISVGKRNYFTGYRILLYALPVVVAIPKFGCRQVWNYFREVFQLTHSDIPDWTMPTGVYTLIVQGYLCMLKKS